MGSDHFLGYPRFSIDARRSAGQAVRAGERPAGREAAAGVSLQPHSEAAADPDAVAGQPRDGGEGSTEAGGDDGGMTKEQRILRTLSARERELWHALGYGPLPESRGVWETDWHEVERCPGHGGKLSKALRSKVRKWHRDYRRKQLVAKRAAAGNRVRAA